MSSESTKTGAWIVAAGILAVAAFAYLPQQIELESQAKVNEPLFPDYQPSGIWEIRIQRSPSAEFKQRQPSAGGMETLTIKRHANRGWELLEFAAYPAENTQRLGSLSTILNELKILEVISENAGDDELADYGLLEPENTTAEESQKGIRLRLSLSSDEAVGDVIVGRAVPAKDQAAATAYIRPSSEKVIYRVGLDKSKLTTALVDWINPNLLGIPGPPDLGSFGPTFRTVELIEANTPASGRQDCDPYRAEFRYGEQVSVGNLSTYENSEWVPSSWERLPASVEFGQAWKRGLDVVPAFLLPRYVQLKTPALQAVFRSPRFAADTDLGMLAPLGFMIESFAEGPRLIGETGLISVNTKGGIRFHFAIGRAVKDETAPVVIYADLAPEVGLAKPELGELPGEAAGWSDEQKATETETLKRTYAQQLEEWNLFNQQRDQDLASLNERLSTWVYYMPTAFVQQAVPSIRFSVEPPATTPPAPTPTGEAPDGSAKE